MIPNSRVPMPDLLTVREVARRLSISERTVWRWTALGLLPPPVHPHARSTRWRAADIERYLEELAACSNSAAGHGETLPRGPAPRRHLPRSNLMLSTPGPRALAPPPRRSASDPSPDSDR